MLTYTPLSTENIKEVTALVYSVFPSDFENQEGPRSYKISLDRNGHEDYIEEHHLDILKYFVVKNSPSEKIIGATGWYTLSTDSKDIAWLGWYCLDPNERGKGFGREILEWTINQVKEKGYKIMKLYTSTDPNEATAQVLYEKMGFKIVDEELKDGEIYKTLYREKIL